jgi:phosphotransferase system  glucose/maltose/N-acetylglucosamine-specific IIC component
MIQNAIGITVGAIVSLILLTFMVNGPDVSWDEFVAPLVIGGLAAFFWPVVIGFWLGRRAKARRNTQIESEVQRQLDQRGGTGR